MAACCPLFARPTCLRDPPFRFDMALCAIMRAWRLTSFFFRSWPEFIGELLLIYFFVRWLDRHA
ncbi:hypothetical protein GD429_39115 [Burkholderia sp. BE17]|nr:hypothetical protein [Burkholderia sp. BE17]